MRDQLIMLIAYVYSGHGGVGGGVEGSIGVRVAPVQLSKSSNNM